MKAGLSVVALLAGLLLLPAALSAQSLFEKLVMPGEVIQGHAKLEKECGNCHEAFSKASQRRLCLDCHKDVARDIDGKTGFHGRRPDVQGVECKHCHTDHKGRAADIVLFDPETFNHAFSDFQLTGAHSAARCDGCHASGKKFRDAASACVGCHKKDEPHKGALGEKCQSCHSDTSWRERKSFDHDKTDFKLVGAHKTVQCILCHAGERYKDLPHACIDCHKSEDVHQGRFGTKCETCHGSEKWKGATFDHDKSTKFPLAGGHKDLKCEACHQGPLDAEKLATTCVSCHKKDDPHQGQQGTRCEQCHVATGWHQSVAFDHDLTRFPLIGLHARVPCEECHRSSTFKDAPTACRDCHKDDVHGGRLGGECQQCHTPNGFALWRFDHARATKFPLTGAHAATSCHACHTARQPSSLKLPTDCIACHAGDDAHRGEFGRECGTCHGMDSFAARPSRGR